MNIPSNGIRVFVSSTFTDLERERDYLVRYSFPQLKKLCEMHGVPFDAIDLRWGIPENQSIDSDLITILFKEIDNCRPYFIGILGERYGFIPNSLPNDIVKNVSISCHKNCSITELEIIYGALNCSVNDIHAYFYIRKKNGKGHLENKLCTVRPEHACNDCIREKSVCIRLEELKERISKSTFPIREFSSPKELGQHIVNDLGSCLKKHLSPLQNQDFYIKECYFQKAKADIYRYIYVQLKDCYNFLSNYIESQKTPLIIIGEQGSGKSSLLTNWSSNIIEERKDILVIQFFIGATPQSTNWRRMLIFFMKKISKKLSIVCEIPTIDSPPEEIWIYFWNLLLAIPAYKKILLIIDGLNRLDDEDQARSLPWLPNDPPIHIKIIISTRPGFLDDMIKKRNWTVFYMRLLEEEEKKNLIKRHLHQYGKHYDQDIMNALFEKIPNKSPFYTKIFLTELTFQKKDMVQQRIDQLSKERSIRKLCRKLVHEVIKEFDIDNSGWVSNIFNLLYTSRFGLSESELRHLLGNANLPFSSFLWSPFKIRIDHLLLNNSGYYSISDLLKIILLEEGIIQREEEIISLHKKMFIFFQNHANKKRRIEEVPWHLLGSKSWEELRDLLMNQEWFEDIWTQDVDMVFSCWSQLEMKANILMTEVYHCNPITSENSEFMLHLAQLFYRYGYIYESIDFWEALIEYYETKDDSPCPLDVLYGYTCSMMYSNQVDKGIKLIKKIRELYGNELNKTIIARIESHEARICRSERKYEKAIELYELSAKITKENGDVWGYVESINGQGITLVCMERFEDALSKFYEATNISELIGDSAGLAQGLENQALLIFSKDVELALRMLVRAEEICRKAGLLGDLLRIINNQLSIHMKINDIHGAKKAKDKLLQLPKGLQSNWGAVFLIPRDIK